MTLAATLNKIMPARRSSGPRPRHAAKLLDQLHAHERVAHVDREPQDGWFITLKGGWRSHYDPLCPVHCFGASTLRGALSDVCAALPCACDQCKSEATIA